MVFFSFSYGGCGPEQGRHVEQDDSCMLHLTKRAAFALQLAPAAGTIVGNDLLKHGCQCAPVDRFPLTDRHCTGGLVVVSARDNLFNLHRPPARLLAMICLNMVVSARLLIVSP